MATARHTIRAMLEEQGISQRELARLAGVDHTYLSRYLRGALPGEPSERWLRDVATALGTNLDKIQRRSS